ncbi:MAG: alpha/beta hydrolase-fold protein [Planctomycetota bacterium]|nr:alpha/beta hydrolase-fold protein [Planctomycetota bacterium]
MGLSGKAELAGKYLKLAYNAGFDDTNHMQNDPDFDKVRGKKAFNEVLEEIVADKARKEADTGEMMWFRGEAFFRCQMHFPKNFDPEKEYPLVVGLHGLGDAPEHYVGLKTRFQNQDFIFAVPQAAISPSQRQLRRRYSWYLWGTDKAEEAVEMAALYIASTVRAIHRKYNISETTALGFSQGASYSIIMGVKYHRLFDRVAAFGGWIDPSIVTDADLQEVENLEVFIAHGRNDKVCPYTGAVSAVALLEKHGIDVVFESFDGGHKIDRETFRKAEAWLLRDKP